METRIKKAKVKDGLLETGYVKAFTDGNENEVTEKGAYLVHGDLAEAFAKLVPHLAKLCDLREGDAVGDDIRSHHEEAFANIRVTGFTVAGEGDQEGVVLVGSKRIGGKVLNLVSPFQKWQDENAPYQFADELYTDIDSCRNEVLEYLFNGKYAITQMELEFDGEDME